MKKLPGRFTIQFNQEDPQQRMASELLEQQGRRKAQFLTSAILCYVQHPEPRERNAGPAELDEARLEQMLLSILRRYPQFADGLANEAAESSVRPPPVSEPWEAVDADALAAISNTLAAFSQD